MIKNIFSLSLMLGISTATFAQIATIEVNVKNAKNNGVNLVLPVNHNYFEGNRKNLSLDSAGILKIRLKEDETGPVTVEVLNKKAFLYVQKGNSIKLNIDTSNKSQPMQFEGSNAAGQQFLTERFLPNGRYTNPVMYEAYHYFVALDAETTTKKVQEKQQSDLSFCKQLFNQSKIDKNFHEYLVASTNYLYAGIISYSACLLKNSNLKKELSADTLWENVYQQYPLQASKAPQTLWFNAYYSFYYLEDYKRYQIEKNNGTPPESFENEDLKRMWFIIKSGYKSKEAEYIHAYALYTIASGIKYQSVLIEWFNDFKKQYPNSKYTQYIQPLIDKVVVFSNKSKAPYTAVQKIMENYGQINSLKELTDKLKGKTIFIDTWATWCGPCNRQFQFTKDLHQFLEKNDVTMVYISIDEDKYEQRWKDMIKYYDLAGIHVRTNNELKKDIDKVIWGGKGNVVPTYIIIDKNGNIVEKNAFWPSEKEKLYEQITKYL